MHLVGCTIEIYYDARSYKHQIRLKCVDYHSRQSEIAIIDVLPGAMQKSK